MTRRAIKLHEKDIAKKAKLNNKAFWKFINSKTKLRLTIPDLYTSNDLDKQKMTKNDHEKSNKLAEYFSTVYTTEPDFSWVLQEEEKPIIKEKLDIVITREIVKKKVHELNINKSLGPNNLHPRDVVSISLAFVYNI